MRTHRLCLALVLFLSGCAQAYATTTWYVFAGGGTRYDTRLENGSPIKADGQCDGKSSAPYPGSGVNQHCAFGDLRFLWDDGAGTYGHWHDWVIAGGDTVILDHNLEMNVGLSGSGAGGNYGVFCTGGNGNGACFNPTIPAGTVAQLTTILGDNYANCSAVDPYTGKLGADKSKVTRIVGRYGTLQVLNLQAAQHVKVGCIEITQRSTCSKHGLPLPTAPCATSYPVDDTADNGVEWNKDTSDVTLQDVWIHGFQNSGILGAVANHVTLNRVAIEWNVMGGMNLDDGTTGDFPNAYLELHNVSILGSGCYQEQPAAHFYPASKCYDQQSTAYGDAIGTSNPYGMDLTCDDCTFKYNGEDAIDAGHVVLGTHTFRVTNSVAMFNYGGSWKFSTGFKYRTLYNNYSIWGGTRMQNDVPGFAPGFNTYLQGQYSSACRSGDHIPFNMVDNGTSTVMDHLTVITTCPVIFDVQCQDPSGACPSHTWTLTNSVMLSYFDPQFFAQQQGIQSDGPGNAYTGDIGTNNRSYNTWHVFHGGCPANMHFGSAGIATNEDCLDPKLAGQPAYTTGAGASGSVAFANESDLDAFTGLLAAGSPMIGAGHNYGRATDANGYPYNTATPSRGAYEFGSTYTPSGGTPAPTPNPCTRICGNIQIQNVIIR